MRTRPFIILLALLLGLTACGGEDGAGEEESGTTAGTATEVTLIDFEIQAPDTAPTGEFVVTNDGEVAHTWTADDGTWDTGSIDSGGEATITITEPGTYPYVCTIHPAQMTGTIEVTG